MFQHRVEVARSEKDRIPDFSRVGYRQGHVQIPLFPVKKTLKPAKDQSDDTIRIQNAIDDVGPLPLVPLGRDDIMVRGAVLLKKGLYRVAGSLIIDKSGVVLRGEGSDALLGTTILGTKPEHGDFIQINAGLDSSAAYLRTGQEYGGILLSNYKPPANPGTRIREGVYIPVGTTILPVDDTRDFNVDEKIVIELPGSSEWLKDIGMNGSWTPSMVKFKFERTIVDIDRTARTLTIDAPMVMNIDPKYPQHAAKIYSLAHRIPATRGGIEASRYSSFITIQNSEVDHRGFTATVTKGARKGFALNGQMSLVNNCTTGGAFHDFTSIGPVCGKMLLNSLRA
ncbi:hypothetical protein BGZ68_004201 [Mortierella alpina]|nr:hypothetical protein BGZ68_004201 [Mortierella alpina]